MQTALREARAIFYEEKAFRAMSGGSIIHNLNFEHLWAGNSARYRRLFEEARDGILILDVESGQITDVNPFLMDLS